MLLTDYGTARRKITEPWHLDNSEQIWQKKSFSQMNFMEKYGANVAGLFWNAGTVLQLAIGIALYAPLQITSAIFNILSPCSYLFVGHKNWGVALGGILGIIGGTLALYPGLVGREAGTIFGFVTMCVFISMSIFSAPLTRHFGEATNPWLRATLGRPRRLDGYGSFLLSRLPIIYESISHQRWGLVAVFCIWSLGDLALSFSKPEEIKASNKTVS